MRVEKRNMEYSLSSEGNPDTEWTEDYLCAVRECKNLNKLGINATIIQREVAYSQSFPAKMRVDVERLEEALYTQLSANVDLKGVSDEKIQDLAQELSINSLPFFTEALAYSLYAEARGRYDDESQTARLDEVERFVSWLRSLGGVGGWSNTAGNNDMKTFRKKNEKEDSDEDFEENFDKE